MQARARGFKEGWLVAPQIAGVPGDSQLWNPKQIPHPTFTNPIQSQADDVEDTPSIRELMEAINTHVENLDLGVTSNLNAPSHEEIEQPPTEDAPGQLANDEVPFFPTDPVA